MSALALTLAAAATGPAHAAGASTPQAKVHARETQVLTAQVNLRYRYEVLDMYCPGATPAIAGWSIEGTENLENPAAISAQSWGGGHGGYAGHFTLQLAEENCEYVTLTVKLTCKSRPS